MVQFRVSSGEAFRVKTIAVLALGMMGFAAFGQSSPMPRSGFTVWLDAAAPGPVSGRMLVFAKKGAGDQEVSAAEFAPEDVWVGALEVHDLQPGAAVRVDGEAGGGTAVYPDSFSRMPAGVYEVQAVLDTDHSYNYSGRGPQDWISAVVPVAPAGTTLTLNAHPETSAARAARRTKIQEAVKPGEIEMQRVESPALTRFWGSPTFVQGYVVLPPGYAEHAKEQYPAAYYTAGFGGGLSSGLAQGIEIRKRMLDGSMPPMIWVMLDESCAHGTHEFADSVNNGPWGQALTAEYIPMLEAKYRMDARPTGRFLNGHSSGGWATLQLQVNYPQVFGGTWSTSPDPSDFHDFTGPDLYRAGANFYARPDGQPYPIMRVDGKVVSYIKPFAQLEGVLGPYGGQFSSFEWVFSPRGQDGAPMPMFDRSTGAVDPKVVAYWGEHYDLANITERTWPQRGPMLRGRIHLFVGTADTFYLDGAAHLFESRLTKLGAEPHFTYLPGRSHFDLYAVGKDQEGLFDQIGREMYAVARPGMNGSAAQ